MAISKQLAMTNKDKLLLGCFLIGFCFYAKADPSLFDTSLHGLLDLRYQYSAARPGEAENGLGKFRVGGHGNRFRANEAALTLQSSLGWDWSGILTVKYANKQYNPLDLSEAFLSYRPVSTSAWQFNARLGMFFPPISLENTGTAWSSPYTLSSSAINSWVGEELKTFGGELRVNYQSKIGHRLGLFAAGLANNDTTGLQLAWRGWSLSDYESTLNDRLRLPNNIGIQANFPKQAALSRPFVEVDGKPGYYAGFSAERSNLYSVRALYYDNRANPAAISNGQYGWHTRFYSIGLKAELPWSMTLISQGLSGRTTMGARLDTLFPVDVRFWATSVLLSKSLNKHRISLRYDRFGTNEWDFLPQDNNREQGYAWTANYNLTLAQRHQLNFEVSQINSDRPARLNIGQSPHQEETLWQIAYRLFF